MSSQKPFLHKSAGQPSVCNAGALFADLFALRPKNALNRGRLYEVDHRYLNPGSVAARRDRFSKPGTSHRRRHPVEFWQGHLRLRAGCFWRVGILVNQQDSHHVDRA